MNALETIYQKINIGAVYGEYCKHVKYPCYYAVLSADKNYIYWSRYGSSANKNTIKNLEWIIKNIFDTTPEKFLKTYTHYKTYHYNAEA